MALFEHFLNLNLGVFELLNFVSSLGAEISSFFVQVYLFFTEKQIPKL